MNLFIPDILCIQTDRGLHCEKCQYLKKMVLHYVSYDSIVIEVPIKEGHVAHVRM